MGMSTARQQNAESLQTALNAAQDAERLINDGYAADGLDSLRITIRELQELRRYTTPKQRMVDY